MQTKDSSYAGSKAEAEPQRSMDERITAMLKARGLCFNPFRLTHSECDAQLQAMQIRTPLVQLHGESPCIIYGEDGSGKTARLLRDLHQGSRQYPERRVLPVRFNVPSVGSSVGFESALAQAIAVSLFTTALLHAPSFQPALATRLAAALDAYLDQPDWRALLAGAGSEEGLVLMYDLAGMPRPAQGIALPDSWLPLADVPAQTDDSASVTQADVAQLVELAERMGARSLLIMADNLSAPGRAIEDISAWAASIWAWQGSTSCVKVQLYAPLAAQQAIEAVIGVHPSAVIRWDEQALRAMLERRLRVASDGVVSDLQSLGWHEQDQTDMVEQAGGSPRRLIALIRDALAVQAEHVSFQSARKPAHAPATVNQDNAGVYLKTAAEVSRPQAIALAHPRVLPKNMTGWMS